MKVFKRKQEFTREQMIHLANDDFLSGDNGLKTIRTQFIHTFLGVSTLVDELSGSKPWLTLEAAPSSHVIFTGLLGFPLSFSTAIS